MMMKITSRTIHVTVTLSVEVPEHEANTDAKAMSFAKESWRQLGNEFDCKAVVFERETEEEQKVADKKRFRDLYMKKGK